MNIDLTTGLLKDILYQPSAYHNDRPDSTVIDMIVVHGISLPPGQFGTGAIQRFFAGTLDFNEHSYYKTLTQLRAASHLLIDRTGEVTQFVPFHLRAWHAGASSFKGKSECNDFSIGIELEGTDETPYEPIQYQQLARVISILQKTYPAITRERIVGHSDIAPGRKTDPGPFFSWSRLDELLYSQTSP